MFFSSLLTGEFEDRLSTAAEHAVVLAAVKDVSGR
jgi:hypothetical protein